MPEIILHHYPTSPFAEKVRIALGIKNIPWRSVIIPMIMPKPDLTALTGGYRKTPVMQIGADIYCDTMCILDELEKRFPQPSFYQGTSEGLATALAFANDRSIFSGAVGLVFGQRSDIANQDFIADRAKFSGREIDVARLKGARPLFEDQLRIQLAWFESALSDGRAFLFGAKPTLADCSLYHVVWFVSRNLGAQVKPLDEFPQIRAWLERMAAVGHGKPTPMDSKEALQIAANATPAAQRSADDRDPFGRKPGDLVSVVPDDTGRDPVEGEIISISARRIAIGRTDPQLGEIAVHFPRAGFLIHPAS